MTDHFVTVPDSLELPAAVKVPASRISDSTTVGRSVLTAADAATARTSIGAKTDRPPVSASSLRTWGHSYMSGSTTSVAGSSLGTSDMATLMAQGLGLPLVQSAVSGATLHTAASAGDWGDILQGEIRSTYGSYKPFGGAWAVMYGLNGAARIGHTYSELAPFKASLRAAVSRFLAMSVFEDNSSTITKTGTWTTNSATNRNSGSTYTYSNVAGSTITWTPPGVFPGGTVSFVLSSYGDGGSALWTTTVAGVDYTHDTASYALTGNNPTTGILRIPNVPRNTTSITLTLASVSATGAARAMFDCMMVEAPAQSSGVVALIGQPKPLDYTSQKGAPAGPVTDAGVDVLNQIIQEVSTELGPRVVYVDTSAMDSSAAYFEAGNLHPNGAGHAYIAAQTVAAMQSAVEIIPASNLSLGTTYGAAADGGALTSEISRAVDAEALLTPTTDPRLSDARTPLAHLHAAADVTSGTLDPARLGSGTADATAVLHGDSTWGPVASGGCQVDIYSSLAAGSGQASYTWTKPAGAKSVHVFVMCGGSGGGGGMRGDATTGPYFGGGGGGSGSWLQVTVPASDLGGTESVLVGCGGLGGAGGATDGGTGSAGGGGGILGSRFGAYQAVFGGPAGGGTASSGTAGPPSYSAAFGSLSGGFSSTTASAANGGSPVGGLLSTTSSGGGGGGGVGSSTWRAGGKGGGSSGAYNLPTMTAADGGSTQGASGTSGVLVQGRWGGGGGGGAAGVTSAGGNGGNGQLGAGGGGGGASCAGYTAGNGGNGGGGIVIITTYF